ncbi:MAG: TatD family hydrolase [Desulfobacterales bacterium]|jgi:TatD DNase family protein|nr:TatD family hydrolase [Desulfobacterales bacterium]
MKIFDSHCHLDDPVFKKDLDVVIDRFRASGGTGLMIAGVDENTCRQAIALCEKFAICFAAVGIHPHHASQCTEKALASLQRLASHSKVRAWGEIGLDFNRMYSSIPDQETGFIQQLKAAADSALPVIFHERDTKGRLLALLKQHASPDLKGVIHCFSGNRAELEAYLELGLSIGVTGIVTMAKRGAELRKLVPLIPATRLLAETDAPWLTPTPERNHHHRNEPAFVRSVVLKLAEVRGEAPEAMANTLHENACRLFKIKLTGKTAQD